MKVAIAHDWMTNMGGAETFLLNLADIFPDAPIYTSIYNAQQMDSRFLKMEVHTSFINNFKNAKKNHQKYLPFMPTAWEQFNFNEYDVVFSSSFSCAKGLVTSPDTMHICYCHSPMRYAWEFYNEYIERENLGKLKKIIVPYLMNYIRMWDAISANRVDYYIANSKNVAKRIWKHYRRECDVIYSPVQDKFFNENTDDKDYFLMVSRLVPYKKVDLAVEVFNELGLPLVVIGAGSQFEYLKSIAKDNVKILGRQPDEVVMEHYAKCRAFVFPGEEDYGLTPLEAQASGRPVIAYGKGGALETVLSGETGLFFSEQTNASLKRAVLEFQKMEFNKEKIISHARTFDEQAYKRRMHKYVEDKYEVFKSSNSLKGKVIR